MYLVTIPIPYTFPLRSYRHFGQRVFHYIFKETFDKKKIKKCSSLNFAFAKAKLHPMFVLNQKLKGKSIRDWDMLH